MTGAAPVMYFSLQLSLARATAFTTDMPSLLLPESGEVEPSARHCLTASGVRQRSSKTDCENLSIS